jgi:hypothetical protein
MSKDENLQLVQFIMELKQLGITDKDIQYLTPTQREQLKKYAQQRRTEMEQGRNPNETLALMALLIHQSRNMLAAVAKRQEQQSVQVRRMYVVDPDTGERRIATVQRVVFDKQRQQESEQPKRPQQREVEKKSQDEENAPSAPYWQPAQNPDSMSHKNSQPECCICLEPFNLSDLLVLAPCGHRCICQNCVYAVKDKVCPLCRTPVTSVMKVFDPH